MYFLETKAPARNADPSTIASFTSCVRQKQKLLLGTLTRTPQLHSLNHGPWSWFLVPGTWSLFLGPWSLVPCPWSLVPGTWSLVLGPWSLVLGPWSLAPGPWFLVPGPWSLVPGPWSLAPGPWPLVFGPWSLVVVARVTLKPIHSTFFVRMKNVFQVFCC